MSSTKTAQNLSFVLEAVHKTKFEDRPVPELKDDHDVLVNVKYTGICGSDVHYWQHGAIGSFVVKAPMVLGHESAGVVAKVGSAVTLLKVGDRVAVEPGVSCRRCIRCKEGNYNLCFNMRFAATPPYDGTLAKYYVVPEDFAYKLPENVSMEEGALLEPLSVAIHVTKQSEVKHGDTAVIFGAGPIGLLCGAVAKAFGATKVVIVDIQQSRLDFAAQYIGAETFFPERIPAEQNAANIIEKFGLGVGADVAIDATGAEPCIQTAIHVLRAGGFYVQAGMGKSDLNFPIMAACAKELTLRGSFRYSTGDYQTAVELVAAGKIDVKALITGEVAFEEALEAFQSVKEGKGIKVLIRGPE